MRPERFELPTYSSGGCRSIHLSYGRISFGKCTSREWHHQSGASPYWDLPQPTALDEFPLKRHNRTSDILR